MGVSCGNLPPSALRAISAASRAQTLAGFDIAAYREDMSDTTRNWTIKSAKTVYRNKWIVVREYETIAPTGADALYGLVHFNNFALGVLPIDADGCTLLVGQQRFPHGRYSWETPQGGGPTEMSPLEGAKRELVEECGLKAANWMPLAEDVHLSNSVTDEQAFAFIAWDLRPDQSFEKDSSEELSLRRVSFAEAVRMAVSGEITDGLTLVMLLKADHLLRTGALPDGLARLLR